MRPFRAIIFFLIALAATLTSQAQSSVDEQLALQYYQEGEYAKAAELFAKLYEQKAGPYYYHYYLNSLLALQDYKQAEKFVRSLQDQQPDNRKYWVELGYIYSLQGRQKKADKQYKKALKNIPDRRKSYVALAGSFESRELYDYALKVLQKGRKRFDPPLDLEIADLYFSRGAYAAMVKVYLDMASTGHKHLELVKGKLQLMLSSPGSSPVSEALKQELLKRTQNHPGQSIYAELLYWYSIQKREYGLALIQAKALDKQFAEGGERVFQLCNILVSNHQYEKAAEGYRYLLSLGKGNRYYRSAEINILRTRYLALKDSGSPSQEALEELKKAYRKVLDKYGENLTTIDLLINLADLETFYLHHASEGEKILSRCLKFHGLKPLQQAEIKLKLGDILLFEGKKWSASLQYKQVEKAYKNSPIGYEAKYKAARFFYYVGEMEWAKVQLDVLKGATSKLIANDAMALALLIDENIDPDSSYTSLSYFARAQLAEYQKKYRQAFDILDTIEQIFPGYSILPRVYYERAKMYEEQKNYDSAAFRYGKTVEAYPSSSVADKALYKQAMLYDTLLHQPSKAAAAYEKLLLDYPGSIFTLEARKRYRELKADKL